MQAKSRWILLAVAMLLIAAVAILVTLPQGGGPERLAAASQEALVPGDSPAANLLGGEGPEQAAQPSSSEEGQRQSLSVLGAEGEGEARTLAGQVLAEPRGGPVSGAKVYLADSFGEVVATTDSEGRFALEWLRLDPGLRIEHPGYVDLRRPEVDFSGPLEIWLQASGSVQGRLISLAGPLPKQAEVHLWTEVRGSRSEEPAHSSAIDATGRYRMQDVRPGTYAVGLAEPGLPVVVKAGIRVESGQVTHADLELPAGAEVTGQVVLGVSRLPVEGALVRCQPEVQGIGDDMERRASGEVLTGADGSFRLAGVPTGQVDVWVRTPWGHRQRNSVQAVAGQAPKPLTVVVAAPASLAGEVQDPDGKPVAGALVVRSLSDEMGRFTWGRPAELDLTDERLSHVFADGSGRFDFGQVPGRQGIFLRAFPPGPDGGFLAQGELSPAFGKYSLSPGEERRELVLVLRRGWPLEGVVRGTDGAPLEGIEVIPHARVERDWSRMPILLTDAEGRFRFERLPEGQVELRLEHEDYTRVRRRTVSEENAEPIEVEMVEAFGIRGVVVDAAGYAIPDARATARLGDPRSRRGRSDSTDEYGHFHVRGLEPGEWFVTASAPGWTHPKEAVVPVNLPGETQSIVLVLEPVEAPLPSSVTGELRMANTGEPVVGLKFNDLRRGSVELSGTRFHIRGMRAGKLNLVAYGENVEPYPFPAVELAPGTQLDLGSVELRRVTELRVKVLGPEGKPRVNGKVFLDRLPEDQGGRPFGRSRMKLNLNRSGKDFVLRGVPRYRWNLVVQVEGLAKYSEEVRVSGATQTVEVSLEPKKKK